MKKHILTGFALAILTLAADSGRAANMTFNFFQDPYLFSNSSTGRLWLGNFGTNGGSLLSGGSVSGLVSSGDYTSLFAQFRPATSFAIIDGVVGDARGDGFITEVNVGSAIGYTDDQGLQGYTPDNASQFAGQALYLLALDDTSSSWTGVSSGDIAILFSAIAGFGTGDNADGPLNNIDVEFSTSGGTILLGTQAAGNISGVAIPEPASGSLFLLGAAGVLALRRLRKTNV